MSRRDERVTVGGCELCVRVSGSGSPTVLTMSSLGGAHEQWQPLTDLLDVPVVTYGRPGLAGSGPLPSADAGQPHPPSWAARQLRRLLAAAKIEPPFVAVGCSIGGHIADQFAALYPEEVPGLVLIDPTPIEPVPQRYDHDLLDEAEGGIIFSRQLCREELDGRVPAPTARPVVISRADGSVPAEIIEKYWRSLTVREADDVWRNRQRRWSQRLNAIHIAADAAGHHVQLDAPELVALAVRAVVDAVRTGAPVNLFSNAVAAAGGHLLA